MSRPPVADWATDFDPLDMHWVNDPFPIWEDLCKRCPIAHTERFRGVYLPTRHEDTREVAYVTEHFFVEPHHGLDAHQDGPESAQK